MSSRENTLFSLMPSWRILMFNRLSFACPPKFCKNLGGWKNFDAVVLDKKESPHSVSSVAISGINEGDQAGAPTNSSSATFSWSVVAPRANFFLTVAPQSIHTTLLSEIGVTWRWQHKPPSLDDFHCCPIIHLRFWLRTALPLTLPKTHNLSSVKANVISQ